MATHRGNLLSIEVAAGCPICLEVLTSPRQLPCMHAFCEKCLQDYISKHVGSIGGPVKELVCPVCRAVTSHPKTEKPVGEWASIFPKSAISITTEANVKVERYCDACRYEGESTMAESFCVMCEEGLCSTCSKVHRKTKSTRDHKLISIDELSSTLENRLRFAEGFGCPDHQERQVEYYCQLHDAVCCVDCFFLSHRLCDNIMRLNADLPSLMMELKPEEIINQMKKIEKHLQTFLAKNESNIYELEAKVKNLTSEILDIRLRINKKLDELEAFVKREGNHIYKEEMIKRQEENHQCQCLISAVRNSRTFLETVLKFGTDTQKFLVCKKSSSHCKPYIDQIREKYVETETVTVYLELGKYVQNILSQDFSSIVKIEFIPEQMHFPCTTISSSHFYSSINKPLRERQVRLDKVMEIQGVGGRNPSYTGIVRLPNGYIVLADNINGTCCLCDSSCNLISSYTLPAVPGDMCMMDQNEVAVTLLKKKEVQFLSIRDNSIKDTGTVRTMYQVSGVATISKENIVVSGPIDDLKKCYWSLVSRRAGETYRHVFDCSNTPASVVALNNVLNNAKTRVYISVYGSNQVYCFGQMDGKLYFIYTSKYLIAPAGMAIDREDNVYITGSRSHNIHKLSPDGTMLQIITADVPKCPRRIAFDRNGEHFILANSNIVDCSKLHIFVQE